MAYDPMTSGIPALSNAQDAALPTFLPHFGAPSDIDSLRDRLQDLWDRVAIIIANAQGTEYRQPERFVWETLERLNLFRMTHGSVLPTPEAIGHLHGDYSQEDLPLRPLVWDGENWVNFHVSGLPDERMLDVILRPVMVAIAAMNPPAVQAVNALRTELRGDVATERNTMEKLSDALDAMQATLNTIGDDVSGLASELPAANLVGMVPVSSIPPGVRAQPQVSSGGIADLTSEQQANIGEGSPVLLSDGRVLYYRGTGSKTLEASYVVGADQTPAESQIPALPISKTTGLQAALDERPQQAASISALKALPLARLSGAITVGGERGGTFDIVTDTSENVTAKLAQDPMEGVYVGLTNGGGTRYAVRRFRRGIDPAWFGANLVSLANETAINAALSVAALLKLPLRLGQIYTVSGLVTAVAKAVAIKGYGRGVSGFSLNNSAAGLRFVPNAQATDTPPQKISLRNLSVVLAAGITLGQPAVDLEWNVYQPTAELSLDMSNVEVVRSANGTGVAPAYVRVNKCSVGVMHGCLILGDDARSSAVGLDFVDVIGIRVSDTDINRFALASDTRKVSSVQSEGVWFTDCTIYDVFCGVRATNAIHIVIEGTHININGSGASCCVEFNSVSQYSITPGCLFYAGGLAGDPGNQDGIRLNAGCGTGSITGVQLIGLNSNARAAVIAASGAANGSIVGNELIGWNGASVYLPSGANGFLVTANKLLASGDIVDLGNNAIYANTVDGQMRSIHPRWRSGDGAFGQGEFSCNASWGLYGRGRPGEVADICFADRNSNNVVFVYGEGANAGRGTVVVATSPTGLPPGAIWNDGGVAKFVT